jgi:hypothetical protein
MNFALKITNITNKLLYTYTLLDLITLKLGKNKCIVLITFFRVYF